MSTKMKYLPCCIRLLACGISVVSISAMADQVDGEAEDAAQGIEVIEVTSSRRVQRLQEVPGSVVAVNPDELVQQGLRSMSDVITRAPGFSFHSFSGQPGRGSISARGISQQNDSAVTAIYLDDVPLTSNTGFAAGGRLFFDGLLGDVERVELLKGPQGTLFGATAIAGAVRYISREPELFEGRGNLTADLSQTKNGELNQMYRGFYSFPLIEGTLGLTLAGFSHDNGGFVDQVDPASGAVVLKNANSADDHGYSADLLFSPNDDLSLRLKGMQQTSTYGISSAVQLTDLNLGERYGKFKSDAMLGSDELKQTLLSASLTYEMDYATLDATSSYAKYESSNALDTVQLYGPLLEMLAGLPAGSVTSAPLTRDVESKKTTHELRLTSNLDGQYEWIGGLFYTSEDTNNQQLLMGQPGDILGLDAAFPSDYQEFAVFGNLTYYIAPNFDVTAGLRVSRTEQGLFYYEDGPFVGGTNEERFESVKDTVNTYLFTARYRPNDLTNYYARIASGFRPSSANLTVRDPFTGDLLSQRIVEQDDLWSYELGIKGQSSDRRLTYELAAYLIDWDNFQSVNTYFGITTNGNATDGITVKGFEGVLNYQVTDQLYFNLGTSITDSTLNNDEPALFGAKGNSVPNIPKFTINAGATYDFAAFNGHNGWVSANLFYRDSAPSAFSDGNPEATAVNVKSDAYTLVNLTAGIEWPRFTTTFYINNLLDTSAYTFYNAVSVPGAGIVNVTGIPLEPRRVGVSISIPF